MKIKENFVLQEIADEFIVVPVAEEADRLHGIIKLNETGAFLWRHLSEQSASKEELTEKLISYYGIDEKRAVLDVDTFISQIDTLGCLNR